MHALPWFLPSSPVGITPVSYTYHNPNVGLQDDSIYPILCGMMGVMYRVFTEQRLSASVSPIHSSRHWQQPKGKRSTIDSNPTPFLPSTYLFSPRSLSPGTQLFHPVSNQAVNRWLR